jgi:hypothetical protein
MAKDEPKAPKVGRVKQLRQVYAITKRYDRRIGLILLGLWLGTFGLFLLLGWWLGPMYIWGPFGFLIATLVTTIVFGRRAERAAFGQLEGQPGAGYAALSQLRRGWIVSDQPVTGSKQGDIVYRAIGRPGVVLVGEGAPSRLGPLLAAEKRKYGRVVPDVPVHEFQVGSGDGQVPLRKLTRQLMKLPRLITPGQVSEVDKRLKAVRSLGLPIPKGPLPKGARMPKMPRGGAPRGR